MPRAAKACSKCGTPSPASTCTACTSTGTHDRTRTQRGYDNAWIRLRDRAVRRQPWCAWPEGCAYPITDRNPLTGEHVVPISVDPSRRLDPTNVIVLCRRHNSARRRLDLHHPGGMPPNPKGAGTEGGRPLTISAMLGPVFASRS